MWLFTRCGVTLEQMVVRGMEWTWYRVGWIWYRGGVLMVMLVEELVVVVYHYLQHKWRSWRRRYECGREGGIEAGRR